MTKRKNKVSFKENFVKRVIIIISLLALWLGLTIHYISTFESFSIIPYNHRGVIDQHLNEPLLRGQKITGTFEARENNLGIVAIRFQLRSRIPFAQEDDLVFRLKEKGSDDWYYESLYKSGLTYDVPFLPFGFPIIEDSKGKIYQFELESLKGNRRNAVIVSGQYPQLQSKYVGDLGEIKSNPGALLEYFKQKYIGALDNPSVVFSSMIYSLPLLFYLTWITGLIHKLLKPFSKQITWIRQKLSLLRTHEAILIFSGTLYFLVLIDIFIFQLINDVAYIVVVATWIYLSRRMEAKIKLSFLVGLTILLITAISNTLGLEAVAEKSAAWAFMFLTAGTIQIALELRKEKPKPNKSH
jgi:hypothetical protein